MWHVAFTITAAECVWALAVAGVGLGAIIGRAIGRYEARHDR